MVYFFWSDYTWGGHALRDNIHLGLQAVQPEYLLDYTYWRNTHTITITNPQDGIINFFLDEDFESRICLQRLS